MVVDFGAEAVAAEAFEAEAFEAQTFRGEAVKVDSAYDAVHPFAEPTVLSWGRVSRFRIRIRWGSVRLLLMTAYVVVYVRWSLRHGIVVDPISSLVSVGVLLAFAHVGRPWRSWARLVGDAAIYAAMIFAYGASYGLAARLGRPRQVEAIRNIDRLLFLGTDPNVWIQQHFYDAAHVRWYDVAASIVYFTHFVVPATVIVVLWLVDRDQWVRFMKRFATVLFIACASFVVIPTVPPWLAGEGGYTALPRLARPVSRGWQHLGLTVFAHAWDVGKGWSNPIAAMPSLHAAFSMFVVVFFFPKVHRRWIKALLLTFPIAMGLSLVYLAEHYVTDVLGGWLVVGASFLLWNRIERRRRSHTAPSSSTLGGTTSEQPQQAVGV